MVMVSVALKETAGAGGVVYYFASNRKRWWCYYYCMLYQKHGNRVAARVGTFVATLCRRMRHRSLQGWIHGVSQQNIPRVAAQSGCSELAVNSYLTF